MRSVIFFAIFVIFLSFLYIVIESLMNVELYFSFFTARGRIARIRSRAQGWGLFFVLHSLKCLVEVVDEVLIVLRADAQADGAVEDSLL